MDEPSHTGTPEGGACGTAECIESEAARWLIEIDRDITPEKSAALDAWLSASPRQRAAFLRLSIAWRRMDRLRRFRRH